MNNKVYIILLILILSCGKQKPENMEFNPQNFQPLKIKINYGSGYKINPLTGDSVNLLKDAEKKMVVTGKPIPVTPLKVTGDSLVPAAITKVGKLEEVKFESRFTEIKTNPDTFFVKDFLSVKIKNKNPNKFVNPKIKKYKSSLPTLAAGPKLNDNAVYNLQILDVDQRFNSSYHNALLKDNNGNIWVGSWGGGATKYDGKYFTVYTEKEGMNNAHVYAIIQDKKGNIWFGTYGGGISKFDGHQFTHYTTEQGLGHNQVWSLCEDKNGNIWIGTDGGGLSKFDGKTFTNFTIEDGLAGNIVYSLLEDSKGNIWIGTAKGGVTKFDGNNITTFNEKSGLKDPNVWALYEDASGNIWFGTGGGVIKFDGEKLFSYSEENGLASRFVYSIREDKNGNMLFGTYGGGLSIFNGKFFENISTNDGMSNDYVKALLYDESGIIWMATDGGGLNRLTLNSFHHFTVSEGLPDNYVNVITEDNDKNLWLGTYSGAAMFDGKSFKYFNMACGLEDQFVRDIIQDSKGNIWFATDLAGVIKYDGKTFTTYKTENGMSFNTVYSIIEDKNQNLWFGTYGGGVTKFNGTNFYHFTTKNGLTTDNVYTLFEDKSGNIWIGTWGGGITKYDGKNFIHYTEKEGLFNNHVNSIFEDHDGNLWFGTNAGATLLKNNYFYHYTSKQGLHNSVVYSFIQNKNNAIWAGTENGLSCLQENNNRNKEFSVRTNLVKEDGLKGVDFILNSNFIDSKGRAWWGSGKGLEMLDLTNYSPSEKIPEIQFRHLMINDNYIDYRNITDSLKSIISFSDIEKGENFPLNLELPYDHNHLTFHFTAIDWLAPHKLKYQYKLEGLDENWSALTEHSYADYRNIPYGNYIFKVRAIGESHLWSNIFEYAFTIHPPWWQTIWFRVCYVSAFLLSLYLFFRWRTKKLIKQKEILEKTVKERTAEVVQQKEIVEVKHKEITDSINYAKRLQQAILRPKEEIDNHFKHHFLLYKPKDIVAGDFYFFEETNEFIFYAAADCTGHGVPGAMLSIVCSNALSRAVKEFMLTEPGKILDKTRELILETFEKSKQDVKDGMDISFISIHKKTNEIKWAGANNPLWIIYNNEFREIKADKQPIGKTDHPKPFTTHTLESNSNVWYYLFTDGFADQFGGPNGKKFKYSNFQKLLLENKDAEASQICEKLDNVFHQWKNDLEQVDDVCIIGIRIGK